MSLMTKAIMALGVGLLCITQIQAQTVTILESQQTHPLQDMDDHWVVACNKVGLSTSIVTYDFLNQTCLADYTDILIISSAVVEIDPVQVENLETFVESGGSLYIQGEFLDTFPGNQVFLELVDHFGDSFTWGASGNEDIGPIGLGDIISNNFNSVDSLEYFWYGMDGTGVGPFTSLLSKGSNNYGYLYEPTGPYNGKVYTTTDQDWIRLDFGEKVIENIAATFPVDLALLPEVIVTTNDQNFCVGDFANFEANLSLTIPGAPTPAYQWTINGVPSIGATNKNFSTDILQDGDVVECQFLMTYGCKRHDATSNPILMSPVFPINTSTIQMEITQINTCAIGSNEFEVTVTNPAGISINSIEWTWNNIVLSNSTSSSLTMNDLTNGDQLSIRYSIIDPCYGLTWVESDELSVTIEQAVVPTVSLMNPTLEFCEGDGTNFSITGDHWGTNPTITWLINGLPNANTTATLNTSTLTPGVYSIQATVASSEGCVTEDEVKTLPVTIQVKELNTLAANLSADNTELCQGATGIFNIDPIFLGDNSTIQWFVDGQQVANSGLQYQSSTLKSMLISQKYALELN